METITYLIIGVLAYYFLFNKKGKKKLNYGAMSLKLKKKIGIGLGITLGILGLIVLLLSIMASKL